MRPSNVYAVQMGHSPVALSNVDVLELAVHVVLNYSWSKYMHSRRYPAIIGPALAFDQFSSVRLARRKFNRHLVTL